MFTVKEDSDVVITNIIDRNILFIDFCVFFFHKFCKLNNTPLIPDFSMSVKANNFFMYLS